jgi:hypothetical protein
VFRYTISHFASIHSDLLVYGRKMSDILTTLRSIFYVVTFTFKIRDKKSLLSHIYFSDDKLNMSYSLYITKRSDKCIRDPSEKWQIEIRYKIYGERNTGLWYEI